MDPSDKKTALGALLEQLRSPARLRLIVAGVMLATGYLAIYMPLSARIDETSRALNKERKRQELSQQVEYLRAQVQKFRARLPEKTDSNEWVQYVLEGIRKYPLRMLALDSGVPQRVGPYEAIVLHVEIEGGFRDLDGFLHWVETNQRLFRIDAARIVPARGEENRLVVQLTLMGLKG